MTWTLEGEERMDIIRAWKDEGYRNSLSEAERAALPPNPAGLMTLTNEELGAVEVPGLGRLTASLERGILADGAGAPAARGGRRSPGPGLSIRGGSRCALSGNGPWS